MERHIDVSKMKEKKGIPSRHQHTWTPGGMKHGNYTRSLIWLQWRQHEGQQGLQVRNEAKEAYFVGQTENLNFIMKATGNHWRTEYKRDTAVHLRQTSVVVGHVCPLSVYVNQDWRLLRQKGRRAWANAISVLDEKGSTFKRHEDNLNLVKSRSQMKFTL